MKAFSPKSKLETPQANQARKRPTAHEAAPSRVSGFVDNRPEATAQRTLHAIMHQSPQVQHQAQLQAEMNNGPRVKAQVQLQSMIDNCPRQVAQRQQLERLFVTANNSARMKQLRASQEMANSSAQDSERHAAPGLVLQRMVLLPAGTADIDKGDLVVYNMIDYALNKVGGPIVSAWDNPNLKNLKETEELFVVEHGKPGRFDNPEKNLIEPTMVNKVIEALINPERGLPEGFKGTIQVTACWAGVGVDQTPSVVAQIKSALTKAGFTGVTVLGAKGPTTGYQVGLVPRAVKPEYQTQASSPPSELGSISQLRREMEKWLKENKGVDIATAARKARELTGDYVPKYVQWLAEKGYLFEQTEGFQQVQ